jgi:hypothetical protein
MLEARERARLVELTNCEEEAVERIIAAAAAERLVVVLPAFHVAADFAGWEVFAWDGQAKAAHLAEAGAFRAFCGTAKPSNGVVPDPRTRLCVGCESHVRGMARNPASVTAYNRGEAPRTMSDAPAPRFRKPQAAAVEEAAPRRSPRASATRSAAVPARRSEPPPPPPPEPVAPAEEPSLFDAAPIPTPRVRPNRPF